MSEYIGYKMPMFCQKLANGEDALVTILTDEEVIRCRDCEKSDPEAYDYCEFYYAHERNPNGFCAWAERRPA